MNPIITFTTDFGPSSHYVAQMKGVILSALPDARLVDVTHTIPAGDVAHAEVVLRSAPWVFPLGTVHVVVVDPGVGTSRRPIAVAWRGHLFVGPDNGVLALAAKAQDAEVVALDKQHLFREPVAPTFHGRDVFAPVAAELAGGLGLDDVGTRIDDAVPTTLPTPTVSPGHVVGQTLAADAFGNLFTNIPASLVREGTWRFRVGNDDAAWVRTYAEGAPGALLLLTGSDGYLEVACRDGSAAERLRAKGGVSIGCTRA